MMFLSKDILIKQHIWQFTMNLFYIRFTIETKDNQQEEVFQVQQLIPLAVFEAMNEPLASFMLVYF